MTDLLDRAAALEIARKTFESTYHLSIREKKIEAIADALLDVQENAVKYCSGKRRL